MSKSLYRTLLLGTLVAGTATGCEITKVDCDETPEADICQPDPEEDSGDIDEEDASLDGGRSDASTDGGRSDAGTSDAGGRDGGTDAGRDASTDGSTSDDGSTGEALTIDEFCVAQLKTAVAWRDGLETLCASSALSERNSFLGSVFGYTDDAEDKCITNLKAIVDSGNSKFDGTKAQACADKFLAGYREPPSPLPTDGVDLATQTASIGHGAAVFVQLPECRATFEGKLTRDKVCTDSLECTAGLRCMQAPGGTRTCQPALTIGTCVRTSECADGHICVGSDAGGGKTCVRNTELPSLGGNCTLSSECSEGLVCNASTKKCANPVAQVICKP